MSYMRRVIFHILLTLLTTASVLSQNQLRQKGEFGFGGGVTNYVGDLNPRYNFKFQKPGVNGFYRKNIIDEFLTLRTNLLFSYLSANENRLKDPLQKARAGSFNTTVTELGLSLEYNFFDFRSEHDLKIRRIHSPYLYWGAAVAALSGESTGPSIAESGFGTSMMYGVGVKIKISHFWNIGGDFGIRHTYNDKLDGYTNHDIGNTSSKNDQYFFTGLYFSYSILENSCPEPSRGSLNKK